MGGEKTAISPWREKEKIRAEEPSYLDLNNNACIRKYLL